MAIKLADTARPNNYVDSEHLGTYPVAYAEDVWFSDGTRLSEKTFDGTSIQKDELPLASADELGNIYQYVGASGTYKNGMFYECVEDSGTYSWEEKQVSGVGNALEKVTALPSASTRKTGDTLLLTEEQTGYQKGGIYQVDSETVWHVKKGIGLTDLNALEFLTRTSDSSSLTWTPNDGYTMYRAENTTDYEENYKQVRSIYANNVDLEIYIVTFIDGTTSQISLHVPYDWKIDSVQWKLISATDISSKADKVSSATVGDIATLDATGNLVDSGINKSIIESLGTASTKDSTDRVQPGNTNLVESQSVYSAINAALSSIYTPRGDLSNAELTSALLVSANIGNVYEMSDSGTTSALFLQGAGVPISVGDNVGIINAGEDRILFNLMANAFDLTSYQKKDLSSAIGSYTSVEGALGGLNTRLGTAESVIPSGVSSSNKLVTYHTNEAADALGAMASHANRYQPEFNNLTMAGVYSINAGGTDKHAPQGGNVTLWVSRFNDDEYNVHQFAQCLANGVVTCYTRSSTNGSWTDWTKLATTNDSVNGLSIDDSYSVDRDLDLNTFIGVSNTVKMYWFRFSSTFSNMPTTSVSWLNLQVENSSGRVVQRALCQMPTSGVNNQYVIYERCAITATADYTSWSPWVKVYDSRYRNVSTQDLTSSVTSGSTAPVTSGGVYSALISGSAGVVVAENLKSGANTFSSSDITDKLGLNFVGFLVLTDRRNGEIGALYFVVIYGTTVGVLKEIASNRASLSVSGTTFTYNDSAGLSSANIGKVTAYKLATY